MAPKNKIKKEKEKTYPVSTEDAEIMMKSVAMANLRDKYTHRWGSYGKAKKAAIDSVKLELKFWNRIHELYPGLIEQVHSDPELIGISFNRANNTVSVQKRLY